MKTLLPGSTLQHYAPATNTSIASAPDLRIQHNQAYAAQETDPFLKELSSYILEHLQDKICIETLCSVVFYSRVQVFRKIKSLTGLSPSRYIRSIRLQKALVLLQTTTLTVPEIAFLVGFEDPKYFFRVFKVEFGTAPATVRLKNKS